MRKAAWVLLLLFVFSIPWEYSLDLGAPFGNIARVLGLLVVLTAVPAVLHERGLRRAGPLLWTTAAIYLWFCCSFFWSLTPHDTLAKLRGFPQEMMLVWLVWEFTESPSDLRNLLRVWLAGSWVLALLTLGSFVWPDPSAGDQIRFAAAGQDPNDTARFLDYGLPIAALLLDGRERRLGRVLALGYFPVALAGVLLTASRSGCLVALVALGGCAVLVGQRSPKAFFGSLFALPPLAGMAWMIVPRGTLERLGSIAEQLRSGDLNQRVNIWHAGWNAFLRAPILGHGAGSFVAAAGLAPVDTAHNTVLAIAVEGGLCALALASAIVMISVRSIAKTNSVVRVGLSTLMVVWLLSSAVGTVAENRTTWLLLGIFALSERLAEEQPDGMLMVFSSRRRSPALDTAITGLCRGSEAASR